MNQISPPSTAPARGEPFAPGSVSIGLHPASELPAPALVADIVDQAVAAQTAGFAGVTLSEHHRGLAGYLPQPLQVTGWILEEADEIWSGPAPMLLTLRNPRHVAEELAWLSARHPSRFCAGFAPGYAPADFEAMGLRAENLAEKFADGLADLRGALEPGGPLEGDQAVRLWSEAPAPLVTAAHSPVAARRAAAVGMGAMLIGSSDVEGRPRKILDAYAAADGPGPVVWIRRCFIGAPPEAAIRELEAAYGAWDNSKKGSVNEIVMGSAQEVAENLSRELVSLGPGTSLNARVYLPGVSPAGIREQISQFGEEILPLLAKR